MTKIQTKISDLLEICNMIKLEGKNASGSTEELVSNFLLNAKENNLYIETLCASGVVLAILNYKTTVLEEGKIPIGEINTFISYLKRFESGDEVIISTEEDKVKIFRSSPQKTAYMPLTAEENIEDSLRANNMSESINEQDGIKYFNKTSLPVKVIIDSKKIKEAVDDAGVKNIERFYPFLVDKDKFSMTVGTKQTGLIITNFADNIKIPEGKETILTSFGAGLDNVFSNISGEVELYFGEQTPLLVIQKTEKFDFQYLVAPRMD